MSRINVLDESVFNKIAAGEVVEKPASIVKEFIENSLDAKATEITIEIENGGIDKIRVIDNGVGIHPDDVKSAFLPHATSKIRTTEDLSNILTLGFRGEALASIASVSKVKMQTKQAEFDLGKEIDIDGGIIKNFSDASLNNGTIIEVTDLFYNIPARRKFLRKAKSEESDITNLMVRYILANPKIKFTYIIDGVTYYKTNGTNLEDAIYLIYKKDCLNNLIKVDYEMDGVSITGFISKPTYTKSNRTYQTLIINGRYVINSLISTSVQNAYGNSLMKGQFPFYVLNFNLPNNLLDVNVHPNKLDVKFENTQKVYGLFFSAISKTLLNFSEVKKIDDDFLEVNRERTKILENLSSSFAGKSFNDNLNSNFEDKKDDILKAYSNLSNKEYTFNDSPILTKTLNNQLEKLNESEIEEVKINNTNGINENINTNKEESFTTKQQIFESVNNLTYKIVGTVFETYILIEINDSLYVFDQHACHERINYDKLINELNNKHLALQQLLIPYILNTNSLESEFLEQNLNNLTELGFDITLFGDNCYKISSVPQVLSSINLKDFFADLFSDLNSFKKINTQDILKEKLSQKACKASVRAGDKLSEKEILVLLNIMKENNMTLACPHGRPAVIEITKNELEKWFKRKV